MAELRSDLGDNMFKEKQLEKANHLRCRTDKTKFKTICPKCKKTGHSKLFNSPENLCRHLDQSHSFDRNDYPTINYVIEVLEKISLALKEKRSPKKVAEAVELGMIIK